MSKLFDRVLDAKVSRRDFLKGSAAATAAVAGLSLAGCTNNTMKETENETTKAPEETTAPITVTHDEIVDLEAKGKWVPAACWNNCGGRCLNKALVVDGVVMRQKTDDTHEDTPDFLQQRACVRGRARRAEVYSPDRLKTPMKRKNWQPGGVEVNGHLRGMDEWEPITWEEAFKIVAEETKRIGATYGPGAIFAPSAGNGANYVMYKAAGGYYGASGTLSWGTWNEGPSHFGMEDGYSSWSLNDRLDLKKSELIVMIGCNPAWSSMGSPMYNFLQAKRAGAKFVSVDPIYTDTAAALDAKWLPIRPGTDHALMLALAYVMLKNDDEKKLIDWDFLNKCTVGFDAEHMPEGAPVEDNAKDYILGTYDNIPKTPEWAEAITGIPAADIVELGLSIGKDVKVSLLTGWAPARTHNSDSMPQMFMTLGAMGGHMGLSGHMTGVSCHFGAGNGGKYLIGSGSTGISYNREVIAGKSQGTLTRGCMWDAILNGEFNNKGTMTPIDFKMIYHGGTNCYLQTMPGMKKGIEVHRKMEFVVTQTTFFNTDAKYSDIILPVNSMWERKDGTMTSGNREALFYSGKVIEPLFDSKSDREVITGIMAELGVDAKDVYSMSEEAGDFRRFFGAWTYAEDGVTKTPIVTITQADIDAVPQSIKDELIASGFELKPQEGKIGLEEFKQAGVYTVERKEGDNFGHIHYKAFREDPEANPLKTASGKLEIYCKGLQDMVANYGYTTVEAYPSYNPCLDGYEQMKSEGKYEFQVINPHYQRRSHTIFDNVKVLREAFPNPVLMNASDAKAKGIVDGDTVMLSNEAGAILRKACIVEGMMPGVLGVMHGCWVDVDESTDNKVDRAGADNYLIPSKTTGQRISAWNSNLCNLEKYTGTPLEDDVNMNSRLI